MGYFEVIIKTFREEITNSFNDADIKPCKEHGIKPSFWRHTRKRDKNDVMLTANCKSDNCGKICYADQNILEIWNKYQ